MARAGVVARDEERMKSIITSSTLMQHPNAAPAQRNLHGVAAFEARERRSRVRERVPRMPNQDS
jgi:hypothetical protein